MDNPEHRERRPPATIESRRLAELARAAGFGDVSEDSLRWPRDASALLGSDERTPLLADAVRWQGSVLRDRGRTTEAESLYRESFEISTGIHYDAGRAHALNCLAGLEQRRGNIVAATRLAAQS